MTKFILVRHGQSQSNIDRTLTGQLDSPLSALGREQARLTVQYVISHYQPNAVVASDLSRAVETVAPIAEAFSLSVIPNKGLREIYGGLWEGKPFSELSDDPEYDTWLHHTGLCRPPEGESVREMTDRIVHTLQQLEQDYPNQTVVIGTHATPVRVMQCVAEGHPLEELHLIKWISNASVSEITCQNGVFSPVYFGEDSFLADLITALPDGV